MDHGNGEIRLVVKPSRQTRFYFLSIYTYEGGVDHHRYGTANTGKHKQ